jgi:hypothetical protein
MEKSFSISTSSLITEPSVSVPRVCFIGFCDVVQDIKEGPPPLWYLNLGGVSKTRLFFVYPVHIQAETVVFAIYEPASAEKFLIHCRPTSATGQDFFLPIELSFQELESGSRAPESQGTVASRIPGWVLLPAQIGGEVPVTEPGEYRAYLLQGDVELYIGSMLFLHAQAPPISPEEANGLASNPFARKNVQFTLACKKCGSEMKIYAGLEKDAELEADGWRRNDEVPERFRCECFAMDVSLEWIKAGLHAALRPNMEPHLDPTIHLVGLYEQGLLEQQASRFKALLNADSPVETIKQFLESHPTFFSVFDPVMLRGAGSLGNGAGYDFAILNAKRELLLFKVASASSGLVQKDRVTSAALKGILGEAAACLQEVERSVQSGPFTLPSGYIASTKAIILAGRTPKSEMRVSSRTTAVVGVQLYTYDDLFRYLAEVVRQMPGQTVAPTSSLAIVQPGCYAGVLADCAGGLSREHYFSDAVMKLFGDVDLKVSGLPWQKEGEQKTLRAASLVANVLCQKHNQRLSPLDKEAEQFFGTIYKCTRGGIQGLIPTDEMRFEFDGRLIERWMLKIVCGAIASGNYGGQSRVVPVSWVDVLFERREWPEVHFSFNGRALLHRPRL